MLAGWNDCRSIISKYSTDQELSMVMQIVGLVLPLPFQVLSPKKMRDLQLTDPSVVPVMRAVADTQKPPPDEVKTWSQEGR